MSIKETFNQFFKDFNGKFVEAEDPNNKFQCMDLAFRWCDYLSIPRETIRHLYAYEVYTLPNDLTIKYFELVPNTPNAVPQTGDLVIFEKKVNGTAGHISISAGSGNINYFDSFDQNWSADKRISTIIGHDYKYVLGWLRSRASDDCKFRLQQVVDLLKGADPLINEALRIGGDN